MTRVQLERRAERLGCKLDKWVGWHADAEYFAGGFRAHWRIQHNYYFRTLYEAQDFLDRLELMTR